MRRIPVAAAVVWLLVGLGLGIDSATSTHQQAEDTSALVCLGVASILAAIHRTAA